MHPTIHIMQTRVAGGSMTQGVVAIVDDDPQIARALGMWLRILDINATQHPSGESLLQAIQRAQDARHNNVGAAAALQVPLVGAVLDLNLPGMSGIALACALRKLSPDLPITLVTALRPEERGAYGDLPANIRCLKKPFDLNALEDALFPLLPVCNATGEAS